MNTNSISYINSQSENVTLDPSGTDYIDYSNNAVYFHDAHGINPNDENSTSLVVQKNDSPFFLSSLAEFTWVFKYKLNSINTTSIVDQFFNNVNYDVSFSNTSLFVGETLDVHVLKASHDSITYTISGDLTSADLSNADLTGTISATETTLSYPIVSGNGQFRFLLDNTDISNNATILLKYWVKTVTNWAGDVVFAFASSASGTYYDQPDLSFNTGDVVYFDVSNTSGYNLVFGTVLDDNSTLVTSNYSETNNVITLDLTGYGSTVYYFEDSDVGMGYVDANANVYPNIMWFKMDDGVQSGWNLILTNQVSNGYSNATATNSATINTSTKKYGTGSIYLDHSNTTYRQVVNFPSVPLQTNFTVSFWMKYSSSSTTFELWRYKNQAKWDSDGLFMKIEANNLKFYHRTALAITINSYPNDQNWHHICFTCQFSNLNSNNNLYHDYNFNFYFDNVNQVNDGTITLRSGISYNYHVLGGFLNTGGYFDDYRFYDRALSANEVNSVYLNKVPIEHTVTVANGVFVIDGVSKPEITFTNGETYIFDQSDSTNAGFPIVFGTSPESSSLYTTGVTVVGTPGQAGAYTKLVYTGTTGALYYYSTGGSLMGYFNGYAVKTVQNWTGQDVFSIKSPNESDFVAQPDLSFNAGDTALFYVGDSSMTGYSLVFGTVLDDNTTLVTSNYSETDNLITLDLTGYSGGAVYYFEDSSANMGYVDAPSASDPNLKIYIDAQSDNRSGTSLTNLVDSTNNATNVGDVTYYADIGGRGSYYLQYDTYINRASVRLPDVLTSNPSNELTSFTFSIYYYTTADILSGQTRILGSSHGVDRTDGHIRSINIGTSTRDGGVGDPGVIILSDSGGTMINKPGTTPYNTWHHMCVTHDGTTTILYLNGVNIGSSTVTLTMVEPLLLGGYYDGNSNYTSLAGFYFDAVHVYDTALSASEVTALYNNPYVSTTTVIIYPVTVANGVFVIDGVSKPEITFTNGQTYVFDQSDSTNAGFPIVFGETPESSSLYTTGVTVVGTPGQAGAYTKLEYTGTTGALYYYNNSIPGMGNDSNTISYNVTVADTPPKFYLNSALQVVTFTANTKYYFYQYDSTNENYPIVFDETADDAAPYFTDGVTTVGTPGQSGAYTILDLSAGFTGPLVYFSSGAATMGLSAVYTVKVVQNWTGNNVFSIQAPGEDISYNQPDLSFNAGDNAFFDVGDSSMTGYTLVFGTEIDNSGTILGSPYVSQSGTVISLNLPSDYTGGAVYYFENTNVGMGYVESTTTTTDTVIDPPLNKRGYSGAYPGFDDSRLASTVGWARSGDIPAESTTYIEWIYIGNETDGDISIIGVKIMPRADGTKQHITTFTAEYSSDNVTYYDVDDGSTFSTNFTETATPYSDQESFNYFASPVIAQYIRITPTGHYGYVSMRAGLIQRTITTSTTNVYTVTVSNEVFFIDTGSGAQSKPEIIFNDGETYVFDQSDSTNAGYPIVFGEIKDSTPYYTTGVTVVGTPGQPGAYTKIDYTGSTALVYFSSGAASMGYNPPTITTPYTVIDPPLSKRGFSGAYDGTYEDSRLTATRGWASPYPFTYTDWISIGNETDGDIGIVGVKIMPRADGRFQHITTFTAEYSSDNVTYYDVDDGSTFSTNFTETATPYSDQESFNYFASPVIAQYIRITPTGHNRHVTMRAGLIQGTITTSTTNVYTVTVSNEVFFIDAGSGAQSKPEIIFNDGETYVFDQSDSTNAGYPIVFGETNDSTPYYTTGVTVVGTPGQPGGYTKIDYTGSTTLYYFSSGATGMGYVVPRTWTLLFRQTYGFGWSVDPATNSLNESDTSNQNYSIINSLYGTTNYKNGDHYQFKYIDKTNNETVEWKQTSNFVETNNSVTGYELISSTINPVPWNFGGLAISASSSNSYYDGNPGSTNWFYPIGQKNTTFGSIPAFTSPYSQQIELWVYS